RPSPTIDTAAIRTTTGWPKPASASCIVSTPVKLSARTTRIATTSGRTRPDANQHDGAGQDAKDNQHLVCHAISRPESKRRPTCSERCTVSAPACFFHRKTAPFESPLEVVPRQWKVIQTVREKFTCRVCEKITQPPAPFHVIPRGHVGPSLLAMILYAKYG